METTGTGREGFGTQVLRGALARGVTGWWQEYLGLGNGPESDSDGGSAVERAERVRLAHGVGCPVAEDFDRFAARRAARMARVARTRRAG